jgi:hypothetical protein
MKTNIISLYSGTRILIYVLLTLMVARAHGLTIDCGSPETRGPVHKHQISEFTLKLFPFLRDKTQYAPRVPYAELFFETKVCEVIHHRI